MFLFGTSIPTAALPGIGASILRSDLAKLKAISFERFVILLTLTPGAGCSSYLVILGPLLIWINLQSIPKFLSVLIKISAPSIISFFSLPLLSLFKVVNKLVGGSLYLVFLFFYRYV